MSNVTPTSRPQAPAYPTHRHVNADASAQLTPEQADIMDLLEGRSLRAPVAQTSDAAVGTLQRDVVLATFGGMTLLAGLVSIFFMAALGAVLLVMGALLCVAAYEHAIAADAAAIMAESRADLLRAEAEEADLAEQNDSALI